jgi:hypothetical protein
MGYHFGMKTTIEINDELLASAKALAASRKLPFRRVLEDALVLFLRQQGRAPDGDIKLRKHVFRGKGLRKELRDAEWEVIRELAYEGRGGKDRKE